MTEIPVDASFFHFTLQGLGIMCAILGMGWKIIKMLRKFDRGFDLWLWEHKVMWTDWANKNPIPAYPLIRVARPDDKG